MTDRRSSNAASLLCEPICAVIRLRTDLCLLPTPWPWQPRQPSFPATRPCQKRPQTALRDSDTACVQHLMHLSHRHALRLLLDQPLPQTVQHIRQAQLRRHKFRQFAVYGIEVDIRFIEAFRRHRPSPRCFQNPRSGPDSAIGPTAGQFRHSTGHFKCAAPFQGRAKFPLISDHAVYILSWKHQREYKPSHTSAPYGA